MSISLFLTLFRLIFSPLVLPFCIVYLGAYNNVFINYGLSLAFLLLSFTDFLDGYFARKRRSVTTLGALLDPIADKFLAYSTLISLVAADKLYFYWAIILIGREFFITALRMVALEYGYKISVSIFGKLKTAVQTAFIAVVLAHPGRDYFVTALNWDYLQFILLLMTFCFSLGSAVLYTVDFYQLYRKKQGA